MYKFTFIFMFSIIFSSNTDLYKKVDKLQEKNRFDEALNLAVENFQKEENQSDFELAWRIARGYFDLADQTDDIDIKKENINNALPYSLNALSLNPNSSKANHWYAVIIGQKGLLDGTKQKIINSYEVKKYCLKAIEIDPTYSGSLHVMGRWHYNVADLSWFERTLASAVYAKPPKGSFDEAIKYFKKALINEKNEIRHYVWLAKSYLKLGDKENAKKILVSGSTLQVTTQGEINLMNEANALLKSL